MEVMVKSRPSSSEYLYGWKTISGKQYDFETAFDNEREAKKLAKELKNKKFKVRIIYRSDGYKDGDMVWAVYSRE